MKKIKLLTPILVANTLAMVSVPLASCGQTNKTTHCWVSSVSEKSKVADKFQKAQYFIVLDDYNYTSDEIKVTVPGTKKYNFAVTSNVIDNILVVEVTYTIPTFTRINEQKSFDFELEIKTNNWSETIAGFNLKIGSNMPAPTPSGKISILLFEDYEGTIFNQIFADIGEVVEQPEAPQKEDATFLGWYDSETLSRVNFPCSFNQNVYLFPAWSINKPASEVVGYHLNEQTNTYEAYCTIDSITDRHSLNIDSIEIASTYKGVPVTGLWNNPDIKNESSQYGLGAFEGCSFAKVKLPDSITSINDTAFYNCDYLESVNGDDTSDGYSVKLPNSITSLGDFVFTKCEGIKKVLLSKNIVKMGGACFSECTNLEFNVYDNNQYYLGCEDNDYFYIHKFDCKNAGSFASLHNDCKILGTWFVANNDDQNVQMLLLPTGLLSLATSALIYSNIDIVAYNGATTQAHECILPPSVEYIGRLALSSNIWESINLSQCNKIDTLEESVMFFNQSLTSVSLPDSITTIKDWAFGSCIKLGSFIISKNITSIEGNPFDETSPDLKITVDHENDKYQTRGSDLYELDDNGQLTSLINVCDKEQTSYTIPDTVKSIRNGAFLNAKKARTIELPDALEEIGDDAFNGCNDLRTINLGSMSNLKYIGEGAFFRCEFITTINIPSSVIEIGAGAFEDCFYVNTITFGENSQLIKIGDDAFNYCGHYYDNFIDEIVLPDSLLSIGDSAFDDCKVKNIKLNDGLLKIGANAFYNTISYWESTPTIPESVVYIGSGAFDCSKEDEIVQQKCPEFEDQKSKWMISEWATSSETIPYWSDFVYIESVNFVPKDSFVNSTLTYLTHRYDDVNHLFSWVKIVD